MKKCLINISFFIGFHLFFVLGQAQQNDFGLWTGVSLEKELYKKIDLEITEQVRFDNNIGNFDRWINEAGLTYKPFKFYRIGFSYRLVYKEQGDISHRINLINQFKYKINDLSLSYRLNLQRYFEANTPADYTWRNKIAVEYEINKHLTPFVAAELFYNFNYRFNDFNEYRFSAGLKHNIKKRHRLDYVFILNKQFNVEAPDTDLVLKLAYKFTFKNKKKDK
ncbi:MAG: DUF2490 domain-containing protein [Chitinophagales bacterium]